MSKPYHQKPLAMFLAVGLVLILGRVLWNTGLPKWDDKYIPIVQGGLQALATVFVGIVLLRFQMRSQANTLILEHYKQQSEILSEMFNNAQKLHFELIKGNGFPVTVEQKESASTVFDSLMWMNPNCILYLEEDVYKAYRDYLGECLESVNEKIRAQIEHKLYMDSNQENRWRTLNDLMKACVASMDSQSFSSRRKAIATLAKIGFDGKMIPKQEIKEG